MLFYEGIWGHVCGDRFTLETANVICIQLRLGEALQVILRRETDT